MVGILNVSSKSILSWLPLLLLQLSSLSLCPVQKVLNKSSVCRSGCQTKQISFFVRNENISCYCKWTDWGSEFTFYSEAAIRNSASTGNLSMSKTRCIMLGNQKLCNFGSLCTRFSNSSCFPRVDTSLSFICRRSQPLDGQLCKMVS